MMSKRTKSEMYLSILEVLKDGPQIVSHLMTKSNINYATLRSLCERLHDHGLIEKTAAARSGPHTIRNKKVKYQYHITEYGREVLRQDIRLCWTLGLGFNLMASTKGRKG